MAQAKRKRRSKHRGTPAGTIERPGRTGRPRATQADAKQIARQRRQERMDRPPTWKSAVNRAAIAAVIFGIIIGLLNGSITQGVLLAAFMFLLYIPMGYFADTAIYRMRQRKKAQGG